jgi:SNF2 family DNA or RNA helicase
LYDNAKEKLQIELKSIDNATFKKNLTSYFQQRSALLQICACPQAVDPSYSETSIKLKALDKIVEDLVVKNGQKIVIWSFYKISLSEIFARYKQHNPVLLDGSVTAIERAEAVREFQSNPDTMICIANPAAAGAGVTLHAASHAVYVSFSNQAAHFLQSVDRIHRRGQDADSVHYHIIVCQDTLEEGEIKRLREKELRQQELLHDNEKWPNSLDEALAELQS